MDYHKIFKYFEEKSFNKTGVLFKNYLIKGLEDEREFNLLYNQSLKELSSRKNDLFPKSDQNLFAFLTLFNNRPSYYKSNWDEKIIKNELFQEYKKSPLRKEITYVELIFRLAVYSGIKNSHSIISSKRLFYSLVYDNSEFDKYIFTYNLNEINSIELELMNKYHPKRSGNVFNLDNTINVKISPKEKTEANRDESKQIILHGIKFSLYEFALYKIEWVKCYSLEIPLREIYDHILIDFEDPFNCGTKRYNSTLLYKVLKDMSNAKYNSLDLCLVYSKIEKLVSKTNNKEFKNYIKNKLVAAEVKS